MVRYSLIVWAAIVALCLTKPTRAEWDVQFEDARATLSGSAAPEVELTYKGPQPNGNSKYYVLRIMDPTCKQFILSGPITTASPNGRIPDAAYTASTQQLKAEVNINTATVQASTVFYTAGATDQKFQISFCARMELYGAGNMAMATESTILKLDVDTTVGFDMSTLTFENEEIKEQLETVLVEYPLTITPCNEMNQAMPVVDMFPGDDVMVCISSTSSEARVTGLRDVYFENGVDKGMSIPLVTSKSGMANQHTTVACSQSNMCRLKTTAFARLFEKPNPDDTVTDISDSSKLVGTAMLVLKQRRGYRNLAKGDEIVAVTGFEEDVQLARPPAKSTATSATVIPAVLALTSGMVMALL